MSDTETKETLLSKIVDATDVEREEDESAEEYKQRLVDHFKEEYPNTDEGNEAFEELDDGVQKWVNDAMTVVKTNKGAKNKKPLPPIEGLEEDAKRPKRGAGEKKSKKASGEKTGTKVGGKKPLAATFAAAPEGAGVSKLLAKPLKEHGYKKQKERSKAGHIVYKNDAGDEIHVGPGKEENKYMMGWRPAGEKQHRYGGPALAEYLNAAA